MSHELILGDALEKLGEMPDNVFDLVLCSPPYEAARSYGIDFHLKGQDWVDWAVPIYLECVRVCHGLVAWVVEGQTRDFRWSATPALLMADLHRKGVKLRKPPIYQRIGIPGSGGPDWWRNDYETIICSTRGRLPWSDNTAMGHPPKCPPGGGPTYHTRDGRVNRPRPQREGDNRRERTYKPPCKANPGNVIKCHGGGGHMGSHFAHENEAPFPESLAEAFVLSFCPPGGVILDCFCGSGTVLAVAEKTGRNSIGIDIRQSQLEITKRRLKEVLNES